MFLAKAKEAITDFLFPPFCLCCKKPGKWWCEECKSGVQRLDSHICPKCLSIGQCGDKCGNLPFSSIFAFGYYHDPKLRPIITALKFNGTKAVLVELEEFIASHVRVKDLQDVLASGTIIPMPLADKRLRERGFNQADLIAQTIATRSDKSEQRIANGLLLRTGHRAPQSSLEHDLAKRQENIKNSFGCFAPVPENIILIDDVATTGATAAEAARVLLDAGAKNVHLVCLAIGA